MVIISHLQQNLCHPNSPIEMGGLFKTFTTLSEMSCSHIASPLHQDKNKQSPCDLSSHFIFSKLPIGDPVQGHSGRRWMDGWRDKKI